MNTIIKNCRLISPDLDLAQAAVEIEGKRVKRVYVSGEELPQAGNTVDATGKILMPGFIDIHCHGRSGYDITADSPEAVEAVAADKVKEGVTSYLPTTLTLPEESLRKTLERVAEYRRTPTPAGAKLPGVHLEGPFFNCKCLGAQNPDYVRNPDIAEIKRLNSVCPVLKVSYAIEMPGGIEFARELIENGITPSCGHSAATYDEFSRARKMGLVNLTHFCNQMTPLHHRDIGLVGGGLINDDVYIETICDKIHLSPDMIRLIFKVKDIGRVLLITDAMQATGLPDGFSDIGGLRVIVKNGEARLASNGALAGSTLQFNQALKNTAEVTGLPLSQLVKTTSWNQAQSLGLEKVGRICPGYAADMVLLDQEFNVKKVWVDGAERPVR